MLLVGAGPMAKEYAKVLQALDISFQVVCRSAESGQRFAEEFSCIVHSGGLENYLSNSQNNSEQAIVAVDVVHLASCTELLLKAGVRSILIEKPAALTLPDLERLNALAERSEANLYIAYNRRYFSSVQRLRELAIADGGILSFHFEFTEWAHVIEKLEKSDDLLQKWLLANSSHVLDTAFYLGGKPEQLNSYQASPLPWHSAGSIFVGSGVSEFGALFSYTANWSSAGRWSIEMMTAQGRYKLCPLETLQFQPKGTVIFQDVVLDNEKDVNFKPGVFRMVDDFVNASPDLPTIAEQLSLTALYNRIAGY